MNLRERLASLRKEHGMTQDALAGALAVSRGAVSMWEIGQRMPDPHALQRLADIFGVSTDYLLGRTDIRDPSLRRELYSAGRMVLVPVLGIIRAGEPIYADQHIEEWAEVPAEDVIGQECFFLRVTGDSMEGAGIVEGDLVFVRRQASANDGDIVVVIINGEDATIKRIFFTRDTVILQPENPKYRPMIFKGRQREEVKIIGKALWLKRSL